MPSVVDPRTCEAADLPRSGPDPFWAAVHEHYLGVPDEELPGLQTEAHTAAAREYRWRSLAMLALRENAGWPVERISRAFGQDRSHTARCLDKAARDIREALSIEPSLDPKTQRRKRRPNLD